MWKICIMKLKKYLIFMLISDMFNFFLNILCYNDVIWIICNNFVVSCKLV